MQTATAISIDTWDHWSDIAKLLDIRVNCIKDRYGDHYRDTDQCFVGGDDFPMYRTVRLNPDLGLEVGDSENCRVPMTGHSFDDSIWVTCTIDSIGPDGQAEIIIELED